MTEEYETYLAKKANDLYNELNNWLTKEMIKPKVPDLKYYTVLDMRSFVSLIRNTLDRENL